LILLNNKRLVIINATITKTTAVSAPIIYSIDGNLMCGKIFKYKVGFIVLIGNTSCTPFIEQKLQMFDIKKFELSVWRKQSIQTYFSMLL